jgi:hypothetical protein
MVVGNDAVVVHPGGMLWNTTGSANTIGSLVPGTPNKRCAERMSPW